MGKTYWAMAGMLFKKGGKDIFPEPVIIPVFEYAFYPLRP
jgi:hypothetical protein